MKIFSNTPYTPRFLPRISHLSLAANKPGETVSPSPLKLDPRWRELLRLRFEHGYNDQAIARKMGVKNRTIRNCWLKIPHALNIDKHPDKDLKVLIELKARSLGLIN